MKKFYIKRRNNPQTGVYYVAEGPLSQAEAKRMERPLYGPNELIPFDVECDYIAEIKRLKSAGERFV